MIDAQETETSYISAWRQLRLNRAERIYKDLESGKISVRTCRAEIERLYGSDGWRNFKQALRDYGYDHGCLVLTDDANGGRYVAMMEHFGSEITAQEAWHHFTGPLVKYITQTEAARKAGLPGNVVALNKRKPTRFSIYRLPFGDYSKDEEAFFEERGEYIWEFHA